MGGSFLERPNLPNFIVEKYTHIWHQEQNFQYFINYLIYIENNTWCAEIPDLFRVLNMISHE
jgi:hypothetical protein